MYIYISIYIYKYVYVYMYICIYRHMYICTYVNMYICIYVHMCMYMSLCMYMYMSILWIVGPWYVQDRHRVCVGMKTGSKYAPLSFGPCLLLLLGGAGSMGPYSQLVCTGYIRIPDWWHVPSSHRLDLRVEAS